MTESARAVTQRRIDAKGELLAQPGRTWRFFGLFGICVWHERVLLVVQPLSSSHIWSRSDCCHPMRSLISALNSRSNPADSFRCLSCLLRWYTSCPMRAHVGFMLSFAMIIASCE